MLGEFVDEFTVKVVDVFAMPQSGTGVSVEAVDPVFQTKMLDMLKQTGRYASAKNALQMHICHEAANRTSFTRIERMTLQPMAAIMGAWHHLTTSGRTPAPAGQRLQSDVRFPQGVKVSSWASPFPRQARDGGGLVPQPPGLRLLAVGRRHQHAAELRGAQPARRRGRGGPHPVCQGQGGCSGHYLQMIWGCSPCECAACRNIPEALVDALILPDSLVQQLLLLLSAR